MSILGKENRQHRILCFITCGVSVRNLPMGWWVWTLGPQLVWGPTLWGKSWNLGTGIPLEEMCHWGGVGWAVSFYLSPLTQCLHSWFSTCRGNVIYWPCSVAPPVLSWPHRLPLWNCKPNRLLLQAMIFYHGNRDKAEYYHINECKHLTFWIFILKKLNIWRLQTLSVAPGVLLITSHINYVFCPRAIGVKYFSDNKEEKIMQKEASKSQNKF